MTELEFLRELSNSGIKFNIDSYDSGYVELSPEKALNYYQNGHYKFWANRLNVSIEDLKSYIEQYSNCNYENECMAITKANKPCKNSAIRYSNIYKYIKDKNSREIFCKFHNDMYVKDLHE